MRQKTNGILLCCKGSDTDDEELSDTTDEDLKLFKSICSYWIRKFGLFDIRFEYAICDTDDNTAQCWIENGARCVFVQLNNNLPVINREELLNNTAFHEIFEAGVLGRLILLASARNMDEEAFESECHATVFRMSNILNVDRFDYKRMSKNE